MAKVMEFLSEFRSEVQHCDNKTFFSYETQSQPSSPKAAPSPTDSTHSKASKRKSQKMCAVCGDKALGFNFDAVTCESCKAFFRRNALKDDIPNCIFEQKCKVDVNTRRFCTYCRLKKCMAAGMKKDMILGDEQKRQRMEKVRANRVRRQVGSKFCPSGPPREKPAAPTAPTPTVAPAATLETISVLPAKGLDVDVRPPEVAVVAPQASDAPILLSSPLTLTVTAGNGVSALANNNGGNSSSASSMVSAVSPLAAPAVPLGKVIESVTGLVSGGIETIRVPLKLVDSPFLEGLGLSDVAVAPAPVPAQKTEPWPPEVDAKPPSPSLNASTTSGDSSLELFGAGELPGTSYQHQMITLNEAQSRRGLARLLTQGEWNAVSDLTEAYKSSFLETTDKAPEGKCSLISLVNTSGFIVRKLINFAKKLSDFTGFPQACQIAMLKGVVLHTLFLRSATHYDPNKNVWITPRGEVSASILKEAIAGTGHCDIYEDHGKFCRQFLDVVGDDDHLVPLIQVLCLFSPDRPMLGDEHQRVSDVQDRYICLTKHYLEARHGYANSRRHFQAVLVCLEALQALTDSHGKVLLQVNPTEVDPLMLEVFDLKSTLLHEGEAVRRLIPTEKMSAAIS